MFVERETNITKEMKWQLYIHIKSVLIKIISYKKLRLFVYFVILHHVLLK